jgi:hypothetical protein
LVHNEDPNGLHRNKTDLRHLTTKVAKSTKLRS